MIGLHSGIVRERLTYLYGFDQFLSSQVQTVLDCGANVGCFSAQARYRMPVVRIVAVEPDPDNVKALATNMENLNVEVKNVGHGRGKPLVCANPGQRNATLIYREDEAKGTVRSLSLRQMMDGFKINPLTCFLKMDTEGSEQCILDDPDSPALLQSLAGMGLELHGREQIIRWGHYAVDNLSRNCKVCFQHRTHTGFLTTMRLDLWDKAI